MLIKDESLRIEYHSLPLEIQLSVDDLEIAFNQNGDTMELLGIEKKVNPEDVNGLRPPSRCNLGVDDSKWSMGERAVEAEHGKPKPGG